jgi:RHS repeat-associated protein
MRKILLILLLFQQMYVVAQINVEITGPTTANVGETKNYTLTWRDGFYLTLPPAGLDYFWMAMGGTVLSGTDGGSSIQWNNSGPRILSFEASTWNDYYFDDFLVTVSGSSAPATPNTTFTITQNCSSTNVQRNSDPPLDVQWYWQTASSGESTILGYGSSINRTASGNLYLRARQSTSPFTWSTSSQHVGNITVITTPPAVPASSTSNDIISNTGGQVTVSVSTVSGATSYRWYTVASGGTAIGGVSGTSYSPTPTQTTTYYVESVKGNCASTTRRSVTAGVHPAPQVSSTNNGVITMGAPVTLSLNYSYDTYQWKKNGANISGATSAIYQANQSGDYSVQVSKGTATGVVSVAKLIGSGPSGQNMNYIVSNTILKAGVTEADIDTLGVKSLSQTIQYFDGLGRPIQTVVTQGSPNKKDIVQPVVYDAFGRESRRYLPYVPGETDGWYKPNPVGTTNYTGSAHHTFYNETNSLIARDTKPYSETIFEPSPLNRPDKSFGPGADWHNNNRHIKHGYLINSHGTGTGQEKIIAWIINGSGHPVRSGQVAGYIESGGYYSSGQLSIKSTKDEQGNEVREYTNKSGQVVLKKVQAVPTSTTGFSLSNRNHWAQTYYVYDDLGNLRYVLPPELTYKVYQNDVYNPSTTANTGDLDLWAFQYKYDGRKRMIEKKVPGAGWVHMVYDKRDRLVLTQDGVQRPNNRWLFTKYDALNRPVLTGMYTTATGIGRDSLQTIVNNYYASLDASKAWFETFTGNATDVYGYDNKSFPKETIQGNYLSVTYYDDYDFLGLLPAGYDYVDEGLAIEKNGITYHQPDTEFTRVKGLVTGTKVKVLSGGLTGYSWLNTVNYYDDRYRVVQTITDNYKNGTDRITNVYEFVGTVLQSKTTHTANDLHWKDLVGVQLVGDKFTRTASSSGWGASGAASVEMLPANEEGWFEFTTVTANKSIMVGYSPGNADANWTSIKYALYLNSGSLQVRENGGGTNYLGSGHTYQAGDRFRVERKNGKINYYKNGVFLLERNAISDALLIDFSINSSAGELAGFRSSFGAMAQDSISRRMVYDHAGRLLQTFHRVNDDDEVLLTQNAYNELGELVTKELHSRNETDFAQQVDYRYNIRGWLNSINDPSINANALFNFRLKYHDPVTNGGDAQYNGNISQAIWKTAGSDEASYGYYYDVMNRITEAKYYNHIRPTENNRFNETIKDGSNSGYDLNGNIKKLQRNGSLTASTYGLMDNLTYTYSGNRLTRVDDAVATQTHENGFKELVKTSNEYTYDANGNMVSDQNKGITAITYNHLNLPVKVNKGTTNYIMYTYDATGRKLKQQVYGTTPKTTDYAGEFIYENDTLRFINHEEGRILPDTSSTAQHPWEYQYHLKDHLGNVRVTFSEKTTTEEFLATMEKDPSTIDTQENNMFLNMVSSKKVAFYNHTPNAQTGYSYRLSASSTELIGPAKSFEVNSGDVVDLEVYVRYANLTTTNSGLSNLFNSLVGAFSLNPGGGIGLEGQQAYNAFNGMFGSGAFIGSGDWDENAPKAYLNYILFDEDFNLIDFGFDQLSQSAGSAHELLSLHVKVQQKGYLYIYLSNENNKIVDVYFDDFKIVYHTAVEQRDDYYPFGLTFNSYSRENSKTNQYLYNGIERQDELELGWDLAQFRAYEPSLGRFLQIDPVIKEHESPYAWNTNNPLLYADPTGADSTQRAQLVAEAKKYVDKNPGGVYGFDKENPTPSVDDVEGGTLIDCSGLTRSSQINIGNGDPYKDKNHKRENGDDKNGVELMVEGTKKMNTDDLESGNYVTFKTNRSTHQGNDGEWDHIGIADSFFWK